MLFHIPGHININRLIIQNKGNFCDENRKFRNKVCDIFLNVEVKIDPLYGEMSLTKTMPCGHDVTFLYNFEIFMNARGVARYFLDEIITSATSIALFPHIPGKSFTLLSAKQPEALCMNLSYLAVI